MEAKEKNKIEKEVEEKEKESVVEVVETATEYPTASYKHMNAYY